MFRGVVHADFSGEHVRRFYKTPSAWIHAFLIYLEAVDGNWFLNFGKGCSAFHAGDNLRVGTVDPSTAFAYAHGRLGRLAFAALRMTNVKAAHRSPLA